MSDDPTLPPVPNTPRKFLRIAYQWTLATEAHRITVAIGGGMILGYLLPKLLG